MTDKELDRLKAEASFDNYLSMAHLARALYERGLNAHEVIHTCYGIELPEEFFVIAEASPQELDLPAYMTSLPWNLAIPMDRGGPPCQADPTEDNEQQAIALHPDLIPLMELSDRDAVYGDSILCYHRDELKAGRATIFGLPREVEPNAEPKRYGDSLLWVLHEHAGDRLRMEEWQLTQPQSSMHESIVASSRATVEYIEALQRRLASRTG